jgi:hypothetical protein
MRYVFAGDRAISCDILQFLIDKIKTTGIICK